MCIWCAAAAAETPGDAKSTSAVQSTDLASNVSNETADSRKNITNNTGMLAMSLRSLDEFQRSGASSVTGTVVLSAQNLATSEVCVVESGTTSCQLTSSQQLSGASTPATKNNLTNNAYLMNLNKHLSQQLRQSANVNVSQPQLAPTTFPSKPDHVMVDVTTPWGPVFYTPIVEPATNDSEVKTSADADSKPDKANDLSEEATGLSGTLKPALVKAGASRVGVSGTAYTAVVSEKTAAIPKRPRPQHPTSNKQTEKVPGRVQATRAPLSRVSLTTKRSGGTKAAAKTNLVKDEFSPETFTLHETVKQVLDNEALSAFTLHETVKQLIESEKAGLRPRQKSIKVTVAPPPPPRPRRTSGSDAHGTSDTQVKQSSAGPVEVQSETQADETSVQAETEDHETPVQNEDQKISIPTQKEVDVENEDTTNTKLSSVSDGVTPGTEKKHESIRVTVQPSEESKIAESSVDVKSKKRIRFEVFEDLPSPINPVVSPSSSTHMLPDDAPVLDDYATTDEHDQLTPSPEPPDESAIQLSMEAMIALKRLFPTLGSLVRVTLVPPPRRTSPKGLEQSVEEELANLVRVTMVPPLRTSHKGLERSVEEERAGDSSAPDSDEEESNEDQTSEGTLSDQDMEEEEVALMEETEEEHEKPEKRSVQSLSRDSTLKRSRPGTTSDDAASQFSTLPGTQSSAKPKPDDSVSLDGTYRSSSTELPLDVVAAASRHFSDVQLSLTKTLTQIPLRVLPPNKTGVGQPGAQRVQVITDVTETSNNVTEMSNNVATEKDSKGVEDMASQQDTLSVCESIKSVTTVTGSGRSLHRPALRCKPGPIQLGITGQDVEEMVRASSVSSTASLERDVDDRATSIVSGIVQSLRATSSATGY